MSRIERAKRGRGGASPLVFLAGCSALNPLSSGPAPNLYNLTTKNLFLSDLPAVSWQLVVEEPLAAGGLGTNRIAVRPSPTQLQYFKNASWTERLPKMLQSLLVASLEDSGRIVAVGRQAIGMRADYSLKIEIRDFQAEFFDGATVPEVRVRLSAKLLRQPRQEIIASRVFEHSVVAEAGNMRTIVTTFDRALGPLIRDLVYWALTTPDTVAVPEAE